MFVQALSQCHVGCMMPCWLHDACGDAYESAGSSQIDSWDVGVHAGMIWLCCVHKPPLAWCHLVLATCVYVEYIACVMSTVNCELLLLLRMLWCCFVQGSSDSSLVVDMTSDDCYSCVSATLSAIDNYTNTIHVLFMISCINSRWFVSLDVN